MNAKISLFFFASSSSTHQAGDPTFVKLALAFGYGDDSKPLQEGRIQGVQALSGTGGLRVFGELMSTHGHKHIYVPDPTWGNHIPIFTNSGMEVRKYRYYDASNSSLNFDGMIQDIENMLRKNLSHDTKDTLITYLDPQHSKALEAVMSTDSVAPRIVRATS